MFDTIVKQRFWMLYFLFFTLIVIYFIFLAIKRAKRYKYNTSQSYIYTLDKNLLIKTKLENETLLLPQSYKEYDTIFIKIELASHPLSYILKPYIEIANTKHYFEYGAKGSRYLNLLHAKSQTLKYKFKQI